MTLLASAPDWLAALLLLFLVLAAIEDLWRGEINDWVCAAVASGAFLAVAMNGPAGELWQNLLLFALVLGIGTLLFVRGWMGGGDVKLLAAGSLWFNLDQGWKMLVAVAIAGGLETLLVMLLRALPWPQSARNRLAILRRDEGIAYGVAIAAGVALIGFAAR
jgi:prepilin peptidase CpaA